MTSEQQGQKGGLKEFYERNINKLLIIPAVIVLLAIGSIIMFYNERGDIMNKDVTLKGGVTATVSTAKPIDLNNLQDKLIARFGDANVRRIAEFGTDQQIGIIAEVATEEEAALKEILSSEFQVPLNEENYSVEIMGSALGAAFYRQMITAIAIAFLFMSIVVFIVFRSFIPSIAVVLAALFDIIVTLAVSNMLGFRISTTGISAFLLLIGYSVDTDVLLTTRVLKRAEGSLMDRVFSSIGTGLTMTITTIVALITGIFISESAAIHQMFAIILIGLIVDVVMTYAMNAPILINYARKKGLQ